MRLITRRDTSLAIGLIIATVVVFQQPLRWLLDIAHEMETRYHLDLVPALLVLVAVFAFHQHSKRQQSKADALVAANDAAEARARSEELGRLMAMGQAAGNALDQAALQQVLWRRLPTFCGDREAWLLTRYRN